MQLIKQSKNHRRTFFKWLHISDGQISWAFNCLFIYGKSWKLVIVGNMLLSGFWRILVKGIWDFPCKKGSNNYLDYIVIGKNFSINVSANGWIPLTITNDSLLTLITLLFLYLCCQNFILTNRKGWLMKFWLS